MFLSVAEFKAFKSGAKSVGSSPIMPGEHRPRGIGDTVPAATPTPAMQRQRAVPATTNSSLIVPPSSYWDAYMVARSNVPFKRGY